MIADREEIGRVAGDEWIDIASPTENVDRGDCVAIWVRRTTPAAGITSAAA
jgi:hypothetical protein